MAFYSVIISLVPTNSVNHNHRAVQCDRSSNWAEKQDYIYTVYKNPILNTKEHPCKLHFLQKKLYQQYIRKFQIKLRQHSKTEKHLNRHFVKDDIDVVSKHIVMYST